MWGCVGISSRTKTSLQPSRMSMVQCTQALATLANTIGRLPEATMLQQRAADMGQLIEAHLWDEQSNIYVNRKPAGDFYRHISPTSFYPLQATPPASSSRGMLL